MARLLLAVLVPGTATPDTIDTHLAAPLRPLIRAKVITGYSLIRQAPDTPPSTPTDQMAARFFPGQPSAVEHIHPRPRSLHQHNTPGEGDHV